jgi:hypothetical protein
VSKGRTTIDQGTMCRQTSPRPGVLGLADSALESLGNVRAIAGGWSTSASDWLGSTWKGGAGEGKSLILSIVALGGMGKTAPVSVALLKHYVEASGAAYELKDIPPEWQDWIVKVTRAHPGKHADLNPYNSGLFDLRNSLGHFAVDVTVSGGKHVYEISDRYEFGFIEKDKAQRGRHGFPVPDLSGWKLDAARKLLPDKEYDNPGGFKEKWEIKNIGKETILLIPQKFLADNGKPFQVHGKFER